MEFGVFDWIDRDPLLLADTYEQRLQVIAAADALGFWCYHVAEHHQTPLGMAPSPGLFLAAAAQRTRRIRLGPLVYLLPLYEPLRLIEEVCMLDASPAAGWSWAWAAASHRTSWATAAWSRRARASRSARRW